jgi:ferrous iron transport protein B
VPLFALVGNPNCGKTSLFNALTGSHQHVGNWGGVTVEVKEGTAQLDGKTCTFVDLPGTYSLSAYSFEERVVSDVLLKERPDAVINVVDATNLERNLYLTVQLFELGIRPVLVLNMWDEVQQKGIAIDLLRLAELLDVPVVTTIGKNGTNIRTILEAGFTMVDSGSQNYLRHGASFPPEIESALDRIARFDALASIDAPRRWTALKLLEGDRRIADAIGSDTAEIKTAVAAAAAEIQSLLGEDPQNLIAEARYGFIAGALREAVRKQQPNRVEHSELIDGFLTHPVWAFPIFFFFMWLLFQATFVVGEYPRRLLETIITLLSQATTYLLPDTLLRSLIDEGIIHGVGGVIVFLPNILILFFGIAIMEDTGYMARAAFITDKIMHKVGLHGKSFIPILMGLGCNVPAIMAARTLESITERRKTILLTPLISCSARLPVYVLFAGALFPKHAGNIVFLFQFVFGTITFFILAYIFKKTLFRGEEHPFVMELPPYRLPTLRSILIHMWLNAGHFLKKMGGVVLVFSIVIWVLGHFPVNNNIAASYTQKIEAVRQNTRLTSAEQTSRIATLQSELKSEQIRYSSIGRIGTAIAPIFKPLGFEWREAVSLLTGFVAKEIVVSSMGVLYAGGGDSSTDSNLITEIRRHFTPLKGFAFMLFVLLYTPCIVAMVTAMRELHSIRWSIFSVMYQLVLAWVAAFAVYQGGRLIGLE